MCWNTVCLTIGLLGLLGVAAFRDEFEDLRAGKAPFFELPCMRIGGICARGFACPPGTRIGRRGLCPDQQPYGIECCRPFKVERKCHDRNGDCTPESYRCPRHLIIRDVTDCGASEVCCAYENV